MSFESIDWGDDEEVEKTEQKPKNTGLRFNWYIVYLRMLLFYLVTTVWQSLVPTRPLSTYYNTLLIGLFYSILVEVIVWKTSKNLGVRVNVVRWTGSDERKTIVGFIRRAANRRKWFTRKN